MANGLQQFGREKLRGRAMGAAISRANHRAAAEGGGDRVFYFTRGAPERLRKSRHTGQDFF